MFIAQQVASQLIRVLRPLVELIARHDSDLAAQVRTAGNSITLNIAEGGRRVGKDRANRYRVAAGSTAEVRAALDAAVGWGYLRDEAVTKALQLIDRELGLLWGLTHKRA